MNTGTKDVALLGVTLEDAWAAWRDMTDCGSGDVFAVGELLDDGHRYAWDGEIGSRRLYRVNAKVAQVASRNPEVFQGRGMFGACLKGLEIIAPEVVEEVRAGLDGGRMVIRAAQWSPAAGVDSGEGCEWNLSLGEVLHCRPGRPLLTARQKAALIECGAGEDGRLACIAATKWPYLDSREALELQDMLDDLLGQRIVDVRNALREAGATVPWRAWPIKVPHDVEDVGDISVEVRCRGAGAGRNVVGLTWLVKQKLPGEPSHWSEPHCRLTEVPDRLDELAAEMAGTLMKAAHNMAESARQAAAASDQGMPAPG